MFIDAACPKCGGHAYPSGIEGAPLRCPLCGWVQPEDESKAMYDELNSLFATLDRPTADAEDLIGDIPPLCDR